MRLAFMLVAAPHFTLHAMLSHRINLHKEDTHMRARSIGRSRFRRTEHTNTRISSGFGGRIKCNKDMAIVQANRECAYECVSELRPCWSTWTTTTTTTPGTQDQQQQQQQRIVGYYTQSQVETRPTPQMGYSIYCRVHSSFARQFPLRMTDIFHCAMKSFVGKFIHPGWATYDGTRRTLRTRGPLRSYNFAANKLHSLRVCMCTRTQTNTRRVPHTRTLSLHAGRAI